MDAEASDVLARAAASRDLSARAVQSLRRVALTLQDLARQPRSQAASLTRALSLRAAL